MTRASCATMRGRTVAACENSSRARVMEAVRRTIVELGPRSTTDVPPEPSKKPTATKTMGPVMYRYSIRAATKAYATTSAPRIKSPVTCTSPSYPRPSGSARRLSQPRHVDDYLTAATALSRASASILRSGALMNPFFCSRSMTARASLMSARVVS